MQYIYKALGMTTSEVLRKPGFRRVHDNQTDSDPETMDRARTLQNYCGIKTNTRNEFNPRSDWIFQSILNLIDKINLYSLSSGDCASKAC